MNYSKSIKKRSIANRIIISWLVVAVFFSLVGFIIGSITSKHSEPDKAETTIYGQTVDGRVFEGEMSMDWGEGDLNFIPLDVPLDKGLQEFISTCPLATTWISLSLWRLFSRKANTTPMR